MITTLKHPVMAGREDIVKSTLENPEEVRQSLITAYPADAIKEGIKITGDEVVLMKDASGRVIGFEKLHFSIPQSDSLHVALETVPA